MQRSWRSEPAILDATESRVGKETGCNSVIWLIEFLAAKWRGNPKARFSAERVEENPMSAPGDEDRKPVYDRALLLHGSKRNQILTLEEVRQYGIDSFSDPDYVRIYGMAPTAWYGHGIRLLGRTAVECTRDALGDRIGRDIASIAETLPKTTHFAIVCWLLQCALLDPAIRP
jgi:hypothetical protein